MGILTGIGVVFDLNQVEGGHNAMKIFMKYSDPRKMIAATIYEGDTNETLSRRENEYCIAVKSLPSLVDTDHIRSAFESCPESGLAVVHRRFLEGDALDCQQLMQTGYIDGDGCLVTESWIRLEHDLCKNAGWGYRPQSIDCELTRELRAELEEMRGF